MPWGDLWSPAGARSAPLLKETVMIQDRLIKRIKELSSPIVVGLDPQLSQLPGCIKKHHLERLREDIAFGDTAGFMHTANAFEEFNMAIIDQICDIVPAVKLQVAMYEQLGSFGFDCYFRTIAYAKQRGLIVIGDVKRGDIASTAKAYSSAHIGKLDIEGKKYSIESTSQHAQPDYLTINPYLGYDSIEPFLTDCEEYDKGLFVLVKTSNPGSSDIQDVITNEGTPLYAHVGKLVQQWGAGMIGDYGYSRIGAVVGATHPQEAVQLRKIMPTTFFLVPGYGAQGGSGADLKDLWVKDSYGAIVNSSRGITGAFQIDKYKCDDKDYALASRQAVLDMKADLEAFIL